METKPFNVAALVRDADGKWVLTRKATVPTGVCAACDCRRRAARGRTLCHTCNSRLWRANNAARYAYNNLKRNAKHRGAVFTITFEEFMDLIHATDYLASRGKTAGCLSIDKIVPAKGYIAGNVQVMTISENAAKGAHAAEPMEKTS